MQKDDRFYTFLFTKSSRSKIYIRRIEISKKKLHTVAAALVISSGIAITGIAGLTKVEGFQLTENSQNFSELSSVTKQTVSVQNNLSSEVTAISTNEVKALNYERPDVVENSTDNIGGPSNPFQLTNAETKTEEDEMEAQLKLIERTSNPAFLPNMWAHLGKINNEFGFRRNPFGGRSYEFHPGMDIDGERGSIIVAPANGTVIKAGWQGGYGNMIEVDHGNGLTTRYGHLSRINIQIGDLIQRGQEIGLVGSTGRSTGPHLHFEIRLNDKAINPRRFLPPEIPN
jgi:murein DD-endopeptidase MepM/ murein hydrolase activator NlpD